MAAQNVEEQPAGRRGRVDRLVEHDQLDTERFELPRQRHQMVRAAGQTVELDAGNHVDLPGADGGQEGVERRSASPPGSSRATAAASSATAGSPSTSGRRCSGAPGCATARPTNYAIPSLPCSSKMASP